MAILEGQSQFSSPQPSSIDSFVWQGSDTRYPDYQQLLTTFQSYFGINASQDATYLYINKFDFPLLLAQANSQAESLLVILLLHIQKYEGISDSRKIDITKMLREIVDTPRGKIIRDALLIDLYANPHYQYGLSIIEPDSLLSIKDF